MTYHKRLKILPMEFIELNRWYTFTLNMKTPIECLGVSIKRYVKKITKLLHPCCEYVLYPELSCVGQLHYHGTIRFKNTSKVFLFYRSLYGITDLAIELDTIDDPDVWTRYCTKQIKYKKIYKRYLSPYKLTNVVHI